MTGSPAPRPPALRGCRVAAVIPALNEAGSIGLTVARIPRALVDQVIVVDGNSTDGTAAAARAQGAEVLLEPRAGYGQACASGAAHAAASGADIIVFMDGDGCDAIEECAVLILPIADDTADFVMASRTRGLREPGSMGIHQVIAGQLIGRLVGLTCGVRYSDMCAFRSIRTRTLERLGMAEMSYGWNLEMQMRVAIRGLRVREVALPYRRRAAGESKVSGNLRNSLRAAARILLTAFRVSRQARGVRTAA